ncbi:septation protein SepH [Microbacterium sp. M3]|uniref:Septation protein SepH n=1 Tax=Microbacterium arthrosphaerae TaxID=792652 RepID=A0ABU4H1K8_9MICO|nr:MULTISPECIES: septation protein SepH [Microbacterium]MDW4572570.1 septation protein SepH [Microbacterium arthrosphaerae]MDW7606425.1 septation protein SepH [Microbacterium sp. M3]
MEQLKVIGTEDDKLILATESGERFSLDVDDVLRGELRKARRERDAEAQTPRPSPREIQSHIRSGLSAREVAELLGARVEDIVRFEGPVLAEREHIVGQALAVPVLLGGDFDGDGHSTFGAAVRAKLAEAGAVGERWTSWKEPTGWTVKLEFTSNDIGHDARWGFDPRRSTLSPLNSDAIQLSRQGSLPEGLIPRLRALETAPAKDDSRFDSGAFGPRRLPDADLETPDLPAPAAPAVQEAAIKRANEPAVVTSAETADLLEALRRRRGQREPLPGAEEVAAAPRSSAPVALFDALEPGYEESSGDEEPPASDYQAPTPAAVAEAGRRKGRTSMPSWDEIVFGARSDD